MNHKALIIEDNYKNREIITEELKKRDIEYVETVMIETAFQHLTKHIFTIIILAIMPPEEDYFEFIKRTKKNMAWKKIYLLTLVKPEDRYYLKSTESGADDCIENPITPEALSKKMDTVMDEIKIRQDPLTSIDEKKDYTKATIGLPLIIHEISEDGITFHTDFILSGENVFNLESKLLSEMGITRLRLEVKRCETIDTGIKRKFTMITEYVDLSDDDAGKIRKWLLLRNK